MTVAYLPTVAPLLAVLLTIAAAGFHVAARERRHDVGPASDRGTGIYLNDKTPAALDGHRGLSSTPREGAEL